MQASTLERAGSVVLPAQTEGSPVDKRNPRTQFTEQILKKIVGHSRATKALQSISMGFIPGANASNFGLNCKL